MTETTLPPEQAEQRRLIEDNAALQEMTATHGWAVFLAYAEHWAREHEATILAGGMTDPLDYRFHTGRLQGIRQVLGIPAFVEHARDAALNPSEQWQDELAIADTTYPTPHADEGENLG